METQHRHVFPVYMEDLWKKKSNCYIDLCDPNQETNKWREEYEKYGIYLIIKSTSKKSNQMSKLHRDKGSKFVADKNWSDAMDHYNASLRYADLNSPEISLALANRSLCFLKMEKYEKCINDIKLAKIANYPQEKISKLNDREKCCTKMLEIVDHDKQDEDEIEDSLSYEVDPNYPGMANVLEIRTNEKFGRHIVAKCDVDVGRTVLTENSFMKSVLSNLPNYCEACFKENMNFIACDSCTKIMFCDEKCKNSNEIHKIDCGTSYPNFAGRAKLVIQSIIYVSCLFPNTDDLINFVDETLANRQTGFPESTIDLKSKYRAFLMLHPHKYGAELVYIKKIYEHLCGIEKIVERFDSTKKKRFLFHLIAHHNMVFDANSFGSNELESSIGLIASLFNHSCAPNLITHSTYFRSMTTIRPVKKGQQFFISYTDRQEHVFRPSLRQQFLLDNFCFKCECDKCNYKCNDLDRELMRKDPNYQYIFSIVGITFEASHPTLKLGEKACVDFLNKFGHLPWSIEIGDIVRAYRSIRF